jgi:hypothetical protein
MKKRLVSLVLSVLLVFCLFPVDNGIQAAGSVCFIALNEKLLDLSSMPYISGSTTYVPYWVFTSFNINYSFFAGASTASLYVADKQIYFDLSNGNTYDNIGQFHSTQAIYRGGVVYLPAEFMCDYFGLSCSYIKGNGYGDIFRIKNAGGILSDESFLAAASSLMQTHYNTYMGLNESPSHGVTPSPSAPASSPDETPEVNRSDTTVTLSFQGMPTDAMLERLSWHDVSACFFLTAQDMQAAPDTLRKLLGLGHGVGILCSQDVQKEYVEASSLLFEATLQKTVLIAAAPALRKPYRRPPESFPLCTGAMTLEARTTPRAPLGRRI